MRDFYRRSKKLSFESNDVARKIHKKIRVEEIIFLEVVWRQSRYNLVRYEVIQLNSRKLIGKCFEQNGFIGEVSYN
jgi:hypothetical protein